MPAWWRARRERERHTGALACLAHNVPASLPAGEVCAIWLSAENRGASTWQPGRFNVSLRLDQAPLFLSELPHAVAPGERLTLHWVLRVPAVPGRHEFQFQLVEQEADGLAQAGVPDAPLHVAFEVVHAPVTASASLRDRVLANHARCWLVNDGVAWGASGATYPQFAREARGCRLVDLEGREYVDYLMGWGSALLGYAHERIQAAIARELSSAPLLTLTHHLMPEVADSLCARFPGAQVATFGKNGSDVCTAAVRLARVHTGRPVVLFSGYHGWQDWNVERYGFAATGVPERGEPLLLPFVPNDLADVTRLFETHSGRVAAVMLEPAGVIQGSNGPVQDADPVFLRALAELVRREGALLIFDEIMTGFRYRGGSVQQATGVVPDLTCLGKALSGGLPLSALLGRRDLFSSALGRIFYEPTFKGEMYSFAAAREVLAIHAEQDVPAHVWSFGERLRAMVAALARDLHVPVALVGPPFRLLLVFAEPDARRRRLMRTLVHQELMKKHVLTTQNLFLPSLAHDDEAFDTTRHAFAHALQVLAEASRGERFVSYLEVPPLPG